MPEPEILKSQAILTGYAQAICTDLGDAGEAPHTEAVVFSQEGWTVCLLAYPTPPPQLPPLARTDLAVLQALSRYPDDRLPARRITEVLARDKKTRYSEITIKRALKRLMALGLVRNARRGRRGYFLDGRVPPLFRSVIP
jgi:hypothetical protein